MKAGKVRFADEADKCTRGYCSRRNSSQVQRVSYCDAVQVAETVTREQSPLKMNVKYLRIGNTSVPGQNLNLRGVGDTRSHGMAIERHETDMSDNKTIMKRC